MQSPTVEVLKSHPESEVLNPSLTLASTGASHLLSQSLKQHLEDLDEPLMLHYRINAGLIPPPIIGTQDPLQGGGRLLGEACHFIDLLNLSCGQKPVNVTTRALPDMARYSRDNYYHDRVSDGSLGTATYVANGNKHQVKNSWKCLAVDCQRRWTTIGLERSIADKNDFKRTAHCVLTKVIKTEVQTWIRYLTSGGLATNRFEEIVCSTEATLAAQLSLESGAQFR